MKPRLEICQECSHFKAYRTKESEWLYFCMADNEYVYDAPPLFIYYQTWDIDGFSLAEHAKVPVKTCPYILEHTINETQ